MPPLTNYRHMSVYGANPNSKIIDLIHVYTTKTRYILTSIEL